MTRRREVRTVERPRSVQVSAGGRKGCWRRLTSPCRIVIDGVAWIVPEGEEWNQATIFRVLRPIIDEQELGDAATLGHDELYKYRGALPRAWLDRSAVGAVYRTYTRDEADRYLYLTAILEGADPWRAKLGHTAVRVWWWSGEALHLSRPW